MSAEDARERAEKAAEPWFTDKPKAEGDEARRILALHFLAYGQSEREAGAKDEREAFRRMVEAQPVDLPSGYNWTRRHLLDAIAARISRSSEAPSKEEPVIGVRFLRNRARTWRGKAASLAPAVKADELHIEARAFEELADAMEGKAPSAVPAPPSRPAEPKRCAVTGNPCGTDTWEVNHPCLCLPCQVWLREFRKAEEPSRPASQPEEK